MNDGIKITIEEWAGDNNIDLSSEQVEELAKVQCNIYKHLGRKLCSVFKMLCKQKKASRNKNGKK